MSEVVRLQNFSDSHPGKHLDPMHARTPMTYISPSHAGDPDGNYKIPNLTEILRGK